MRRTTTLSALAAGLALIAAAPASAHHPKPRPVTSRRSPAGSTTRAMSRSRRTATCGSPRRARGARQPVELVLQQRRRPGLHGRERRDHAHQPLGPEARRDRASRRSPQGPATARSGRTASSPTATTSTSPTAARPRPTRGGRRTSVLRNPTLVSEEPRVALLRDAAQGERTAATSRSPTCGGSRARTTRTPRSATRSSTPTRSTCTPTTGASSSPTRAATACCARAGAAASRR